MKVIEISHVALPNNAVELATLSGPGPVLGAMNSGGAITITGWPQIACGLLLTLAAGVAMDSGVFGAMNLVGALAWVMPAVGPLLAAFGLYVTADGASGLREQRATAERARAMPDKPWLWDHKWREDGIGGDTGSEIGKAFGFALFALVFLLPLHWVVVVVKGIPWVVGFGVVIFDLVIVRVIAHGVGLIRMRRRYGAAWLHFKRFPFSTGGRLEATLDATHGMSELPSLNATLRCVQERYELRGQTNGNRNLQVVCYALWSASSRVDRSAGGAFNFEFDIPADAPGSALSEQPARYWELIVASDDVPGVDYQARFLVPVYRHR